MKRALIVALSLVLAAGTTAAHAQATAPLAGPLTVAEQYLFAQANAERAQRALPLLRWDAALYLAAEAHASEMASRESISHQYPGEPELAARGRQAGAHFSTIAENVAEAPTAVRIHDAWMQSPGHRDNLLNPRLNAIGIRVLRRDGQLYAVQDFSRTVETRTLAEQELAVQSALMAASSLAVLPATEDTRRTCSMETGYAGALKPWFVMRYTTADLNRLPEQLKSQLSSDRYRTAQIGACAATGEASFSSYKIAVLLYP